MFTEGSGRFAVVKIGAGDLTYKRFPDEVDVGLFITVIMVEVTRTMMLCLES